MRPGKEKKQFESQATQNCCMMSSTIKYKNYTTKLIGAAATGLMLTS